MGEEGLASLLGLVRGTNKMDAPVPACLNHCINQEVFSCKICGEMFDNIHKYITHGKSHRGSSTVCGWCGGVWPSYSALCIHQLVWEGKDTEESSELSGGADPPSGCSLKVSCPLNCGIQSLTANMMRSHLSTFHGANSNNIKATTENGPLEVCYTDNDSTATCPKCETIIFTDNVDLNHHIGLQCLKRSPAVTQRVQDIQEQGVSAGEEPLLLLLQEIQALILHLKGLLERSDDEANNGDIVSSYRDTFVESGSACDKQYKYLPPGFTQQYLAWIPLGFTRQVLESEEENFAVMFDVWSQVVDKLSGPPQLQDVCMNLELELSRNLKAGLVPPRWGNLTFDPAMLHNPDKDILSKLERELGWVK